MPLASARRIALAALTTWRRGRRFADSIIGELLAETRLTAPDRAFALELFYGVLRNLTLLDFWIGRLRSSQVDVDLRDILRLGLYQLLLTATSQHAAVYETVGLAPGSRRGIINGVLRNASRQRNELLWEANEQPLEIRLSHPKFLFERWIKNFGSENAEALCIWNNQPPPTYARINGLKIDRDKFLKTYADARPLPDDPDFVEFETFRRDALECGHCYIQDPSTALACRILDPKPREKILDACAAPGGKTGYLAQLMESHGVIAACDRDPQRTKLLQENMARLGATIVRTSCCDWTRDKAPKEIASLAPFDRILVDAPCSNTGVMRRRVDVRWRLWPDDFKRMPKEQVSILRAIIPLLKQDGVLVYSTCSLDPEENEQVASRIARDFPELLVTDQRSVLPFRDHFDGAFAAQLTRL